MAHLSGKNGAVYLATTIIDDCEDAWTSGDNGTASLETTDFKVGDGSSKCVVGAGISAGEYPMYEAIAAGATDYSSFTYIFCWAQCSEDRAAEDLILVLDSGAGKPASPETEMTFPALTADTWKYCRLTEVSSKGMDKSGAAVTVGLEFNANEEACNIYLDDIRAAKEVAGIKSWSLDYTVDMLDTTDFGDSGVRTFIPGASTWSGTFEGYKDGVPLSIGSQYGIELAESATATQTWAGNVIITAVHPTTSFDGIVSYSYNFQGTEALRVASA
jgi:hypothetical protein